MGTCLLIRLVEKLNKYFHDCKHQILKSGVKEQKHKKKEKGFCLLAMDKKKKQTFPFYSSLIATRVWIFQGAPECIMKSTSL